MHPSFARRSTRWLAPVFLEHRPRILMRAVQRTDRGVIVVAAEIIIGLGAHHHLDGLAVGDGIFLGNERGHLVEVFFIGHGLASRHAPSCAGCTDKTTPPSPGPTAYGAGTSGWRKCWDRG